jgi:hypothetical protein
MFETGDGNVMIHKDAHREELIGRLRVLRADIDVIMDRYRMNCVSRVEEMLRILEHRDIIGDSTVEPSVQDMQSMLTMLDGTKLKPKKGRLKDLKRVDALLKQLLSQFPTQI